MAAQQTETVDFYVVPYQGTVGSTSAWFVHRGSTQSTYVAVCTTREEAIAKAKAMSKSQRAIGKTSAVYVREKPGGPWRIQPG